MNKNQLRKILRNSASMSHSGKVGVDISRKMPEWAILGYRSYTTPQYAIRYAYKSDDPSLYFIKKRYTFVVFRRNLNPEVDNTIVLNAFKTMFNYVCEQMNAKGGLSFEYSIRDLLYEHRNITINALSVNTDLGYVMQHLLCVLVGKMSDILKAIPNADKWNLMSQIFSNQSNPSQDNYRTLLRVLLNGRINDLWVNPSTFINYCPQLIGVKTIESLLVPNWVATRKDYKAEYRLINGEVTL